MLGRDVSVVGELNLDLILYGLPEKLQLEREILADNLSITLGSSSAIFAHNLALLGSSVSFSSSIGGDPLGEICVQRLRESGVDVSGVRRFAEKTTGLSVILPQGKKRYILTYPGTMAEMTTDDLDLNYVLAAKHLHLSSYFLQKGMQAGLPELFRQAKQQGLSTSLDTNDDPENRWSNEIHALLMYVDLLLLNEHEACSLSGELDPQRAASALAGEVATVVVKRGERGAVVRRGNQEFSSAPPRVEMVDAVGAGDSFDAGFIHQYVHGAGMEACLQFGNAAGALSATRAGGTEAFRDARHRLGFLRGKEVSG